MKYFIFYNGHQELDRKNWLTIGTYAESSAEAKKIFEDVLVTPGLPAEDAAEARSLFVFEYVSERDLEEGEEPKRAIYGETPDSSHRWEQTY